MAKESMKARERKRAKMVAKYAAKRKALKEAGDYEALQKLPKNASPVRKHNRCKLTGRPKGYMRTFGISRVTFREMANQGLIPGVKKQVGKRNKLGEDVYRSDSRLSDQNKKCQQGRSQGSGDPCV